MTRASYIAGFLSLLTLFAFSLSPLSLSNLLHAQQSFALQNALLGIRPYDGKNMPLKDFIQDVRNGFVYAGHTQEGQYVKTVVSRLLGSARDSTYGKDFPTVEALMKHLKFRFAPGKNYSYYSNKISDLQMKQGETVGDFYHRLNILLGGAKSSLLEELKQQAEDEENEVEITEQQLNQMLKPLHLTALDVFIKGLPGDMAFLVDATRPKTLEEACNGR